MSVHKIERIDCQSKESEASPTFEAGRCWLSGRTETVGQLLPGKQLAASKAQLIVALALLISFRGRSFCRHQAHQAQTQGLSGFFHRLGDQGSIRWALTNITIACFCWKDFSISWASSTPFHFTLRCRELRMLARRLLAA
eukprot:2002024-Pleurochrysis_carterae.AAC.8